MQQAQLQVIIGMIVPFVLQGLKKLPWFPWLTDTSQAWVKVGWSALVAAGSAVLISFSYDPTMGRVVIDGVTWANLGNGILAFLTSLLAQEGAYQFLIKKWFKKGGA